jgi:hypothetical protein
MKYGQFDDKKYVVTDFETFYDDTFHLLRNGKGYRTEEYIQDRRFKAHGIGVAYPNGKTDFIVGEDIPKWLKSYKSHTFVNHKMTFDALIWRLRYSFVPRFMLDTLFMANAVYGPAEVSGGNDLESVAERLKLQPKGKIEQFKGLYDLPPDKALALATYARNDADLTRHILLALLPQMTRPEFELWLIDHTLRIYVDKPLEVRAPLCKSSADRIEKNVKSKIRSLPKIPFVFKWEKSRTKKGVKYKEKMEDKRVVNEEVLASNPQFGQAFIQVLKKTGIRMPMKMGKKGLIPALAKQDEGFMALKSCPNIIVSSLVQARLAKRSGDTQIARLRTLLLCSRLGGFRVYLNYWGAGTGRWSGGSGLNAHNFPNPTRSPDEFEREVAALIRACVVPGKGKKFVAVDAANIEARVLAWWAQQQDLVDAFGSGEDVYSSFASEAFSEEVRKPKDTDPKPKAIRFKLLRNVGKATVLGLGYCLAKGTPILTDTGWKAIENVRPTDTVWDGRAFVSHSGSVYSGKKEVIIWGGIALTPQHLLLCESGWRSVGEIASSGGMLVPLRAHGTEDGQLPALSITSGSKGVFQYDAGVANARAFAQINYREDGVLSVGNVPIAVRASKEDNPGSMGFLLRIAEDGSLCGTTSTRESTIQLTRTTTITAEGESNFGCQKQISSDTCGPFPERKTPASNSIEGIITGTMSGGISVLSPLLRIYKTDVYDIVLAGSNRCYQAGPFIAHNSMGAPKFEKNQRASPDVRALFETGELTTDKCVSLVKQYRKKYTNITALWGRVDTAFHRAREGAQRMVNGVLFSRGKGGVDVTLPSGRVIHYPNVRAGNKVDNGRGGTRLEWVYGYGKGKKLYGGLLVENIVQAISRDILAEGVWAAEQAGWNVAYHVHDSIVTVTAAKDAKECMNQCIEVLSTAPEWGQGMKLGAEGEISEVFA